MLYAKFLVFSGVVLLIIGLIRDRGARPQYQRPQRWKLLRDKPADLKDAIYHPKEWRKPKR